MLVLRRHLAARKPPSIDFKGEVSFEMKDAVYHSLPLRHS